MCLYSVLNWDQSTWYLVDLNSEFYQLDLKQLKQMNFLPVLVNNSEPSFPRFEPFRDYELQLPFFHNHRYENEGSPSLPVFHCSIFFWFGGQGMSTTTIKHPNGFTLGLKKGPKLMNQSPSACPAEKKHNTEHMLLNLMARIITASIIGNKWQLFNSSLAFILIQKL